MHECIYYKYSLMFWDIIETSRQIVIEIKDWPCFEINNLRLETNLIHRNILVTSIRFLFVSEKMYTDYPIS